MGNLRYEFRAKTQRSRSEGAVFDERAAGDPLPPHDVIKSFQNSHR
jgi:hypothetical protein